MTRTILGIALALLVGCGGEDHGGPAPNGSLPPSSGGAGGESGGGGAAPMPVKRTVAQRNPFGNVAQADNLLWDGDFEWRSPFADQYGWLSGSGNYLSYELPALGLAERCRSGLKCAVVPPNGRIVGLSLGSRDAALAVSFWAHPEDGGCENVVGIVSGLFAGPDREVPFATQEGSWCRFEGLLTGVSGAPYLFIANDGTTEVVIDDAVIAPVAAETASLPPAPTVERADMAAVRDSVRKAIEPRLPPPSPAQRALESHLRRLTRGRK